MRIETVTDFLAHVSDGDVLYTLHSWHGKPTCVERIEVLATVQAVIAEYGNEPVAKCYYVSARGDHTSMHVSDMLNEWHGAWTELGEAMEYFREREAAYNSDPELIAEYEESVAESKAWLKQFRKSWYAS
jgi:hypothetical protein